ncbi:MAG: hypothetical protein HEQ35_23805 [Gloeotrichia echinulata IR180]
MQTIIHPILWRGFQSPLLFWGASTSQYSRGLGTGDTTTAQCIAGDWGLGTQRPLSASLGTGDWGHNDRSVHRWGHNDRSVHRWVTSLIVSRFYHQLMS